MEPPEEETYDYDVTVCRGELVGSIFLFFGFAKVRYPSTPTNLVHILIFVEIPLFLRAKLVTQLFAEEVVVRAQLQRLCQLQE